MKIGLLTLPVETGYGSILQAVALKEQLVRRGHDVVLIRRQSKKKDNFVVLIGRILKKIFLDHSYIIRIRKKEREEFPIVTQYTQPFIEKHLSPFTKIFHSSNEMRKVNRMGLDAIVVGSDQVWRPGYMKNVCDYFLYQIDSSIRKYAYAASFGTSEWLFSEKDSLICTKALRQFKAVSVRESSGVKLCEEHFSVKPEFVLDPTMLFDYDFYSNFIENHNAEYENKLCAYILNQKRLMPIVVKYSLALSAEPIFPHGKVEDKTAPVSLRIVKPVSLWLDTIQSSKAVVTDSFHGMAFSIIFRKPFAVVINKERGGARFMSLLNALHLEHRIVDEETDFSKLKPIDWEVVERELARMRKRSNDFLDAIH